MNNTKYIKEKWTVSHSTDWEGNTYYTINDGKQIFDVSEAYAKLIEAAPELLEALEALNKWVSVNFPQHGMSSEYGTCAVFNQARAAIKKATE